jgi:hypothetical protein
MGSWKRILCPGLTFGGHVTYNDDKYDDCDDDKYCMYDDDDDKYNDDKYDDYK